MISEAIDTLYTLGWALAVWIVLLAIVVTLALYAVAVTVWCVGRGIARAWKTVTRGPVGPSWRRGRLKARFLARTRVRASRARTAPRPPWVHTQPLDYEEAA